jgi:hypothetical protein
VTNNELLLTKTRPLKIHTKHTHAHASTGGNNARAAGRGGVGRGGVERAVVEESQRTNIQSGTSEVCLVEAIRVQCQCRVNRNPRMIEP